MSEWEYIKVKADTLAAHGPGFEFDECGLLNKYGKEGWRVVSIVPPPEIGWGCRMTVYFGRPIEKEEEER